MHWQTATCCFRAGPAYYYDVEPKSTELLQSGPLLEAIRKRFTLAWQGTHGHPHWVRVRQNGARLVGMTGADQLVVELFALLHDSCRANEQSDPWHGVRAAAFADQLNGTYFKLSPAQLELLKHACALHTQGLVLADPTVQVCWDADRLDLGRVGVRPDLKLLCTDAAKNPKILEWAWRRSRHGSPQSA
jgi:uncharacterized protein